jgi:diguanylate cyclase (GGDEF)-like protein/PAS domain S-box-containing protein
VIASITTLAEGRLIEVTDEYCEALGYSREELIGHTVIELKIVTEDQRSEWIGLSNGDGTVASFDLRLCARDGHHIHALVVAQAVGTQDDSNVLQVFQDMTEQVHEQGVLRGVSDALEIELAKVRLVQVALEERATRDVLTDLFNRRYLLESLPVELARAAREGYPVSVIMVDVDEFKGVNDREGHAAGDKMLASVADGLRLGSRASDIVSRYGGDEFLVALPRASREAAAVLAEGWRGALKTDKIAVSMGVAEFPRDGSDVAAVLAAADEALYVAKEHGRNRVVVSGSFDTQHPAEADRPV